jgi:hypothetical protein
MEVVEVVFIATNHFLVVALVLPTADGLRPCTLTTEIATVSSNNYIALSASSDF